MGPLTKMKSLPQEPAETTPVVWTKAKDFKAQAQGKKVKISDMGKEEPDFITRDHQRRPPEQYAGADGRTSCRSALGTNYNIRWTL